MAGGDPKEAQPSAKRSDADPESHAAAQANPSQRATKNQPRKASPSHESDERRKRKAQPTPRVALSGFGDGIERAYCAHFRPALPAAFPVQHRTGLATIPPVVVDRRPTALLLCNCLHRGPHSWPNGDPVDGTEE